MPITVDQLKLDGAVADAMHKAIEATLTNPITGEVKPHPFGPDFRHLATKDRVIRAAGYQKAKTLQQALEQGQALEEERQARADALLEAVKQRKDTQTQDQAFNTEFLKDNRTRLSATAAGRSVAPVFQALGQVMPGLSEAGDAAQNVQAPEPGIMDILRMAAQSGVPPERSAAMAENVARAVHAMSESRPGQKPPKTLQFVKSPTGADVALSPETGAFQYDPFSKAEAEAGRSKFSVAPLVSPYDKSITGYGVTAQFGSLEEAKRYADEQNKTVGGKAAPADQGKPTRSIAADFVKKFGKDKAREELQKAGYDPSGYAD